MKKRVFVLAAVLALIAALFTLSAFAADNVRYVADSKLGTGDGLSAENANTLDAVFTELNTSVFTNAEKAGDTCTIYLVEDITLKQYKPEGTASPRTTQVFSENSHKDNAVTITTAPGKSKAKINFPFTGAAATRVYNYLLSGETTFDNVILATDSTGTAQIPVIAAQGNKLTLGSKVETEAPAGHNFGIVGITFTTNTFRTAQGEKVSNAFTPDVTVLGGEYAYITAFSFNTAVAGSSAAKLTLGNVKVGTLSATNYSSGTISAGATVDVYYTGKVEVEHFWPTRRPADANPGNAATFNHVLLAGAELTYTTADVAKAANATLNLSFAPTDAKAAATAKTLYEAWNGNASIGTFSFTTVTTDPVCADDAHVKATGTLTEATCAAGALEYDYCTVCGKMLGDLHEGEPDATKHVIADAAWTQSADGTAVVKTCANCGKVGLTYPVTDGKVAVYVSANGSANGGESKENPVDTLRGAQQLAVMLADVYYGADDTESAVTIYVIGRVDMPSRIYVNGTLTANKVSNSDLNKFTQCFEETPHIDHPFVFTSLDGAERGLLNFLTVDTSTETRNMSYMLYGPTTFENISFGAAGGTYVGVTYRSRSGHSIMARGFKLVLGEGITMIDNSGKMNESSKIVSANSDEFAVSDIKLYVMGGFYARTSTHANLAERADTDPYDADITVLSGEYWFAAPLNRTVPNVTATTGKLTLGSPKIMFLSGVSTGTSALSDVKTEIWYQGAARIKKLYLGMQNSSTGSGTGGYGNGGYTTNHLFFPESTGVSTIYTSSNYRDVINFYYIGAGESKASEFNSGRYIDKNDTFAEYCIDWRGGHTVGADGKCTFCGVTPCTDGNHDYSLFAYVSEATCSAKATGYFYCSICHARKDLISVGEVKPNRHNYQLVPGTTTLRCTYCGVETTASEPVVYVTNQAFLGDSDGTSAKTPLQSFEAAYALAVAAARQQGKTEATIYVVGGATIPLAADGIYTEIEHADVEVTIKGYGKSAASFVFGTAYAQRLEYRLNGPVVLSNLEITSGDNTSSLYLVARHNHLTVMEDVTSDFRRNVGGTEFHSGNLTLIGGCYSVTCGESDSHLTVYGGTYRNIIAGSANRSCGLAGGKTVLELLGNVTTRESIFGGSSNGAAGDVDIFINGDAAASQYFSFGSSKDQKAKNVRVYLYGGSISSGSFAATLTLAPIGCASPDSSILAGKTSLTIYYDPSVPSSNEMMHLIQTSANDGGKVTFALLDSVCTASADGLHAHAQGEAPIETATATCFTDGYEIYACRYCHKNYTVSTGKASHQFEAASELNKAATCKSAGMTAEVCTICGFTKYTIDENQPADPTKHVFGDDGVCTICHYSAAADCEHDFGDVQTEKTQCGTTTYRVCKKCKLKETISTTGSHNWGKYTVTVEATDTTPGIKTRKCKTCGKVETALLYPNDSTLATDPIAVDASGNTVGFSIENSKLTKAEKEALNALLQDTAYGSEVKVSYTTDGTVVTNVTYSIPVPDAYKDYENVKVVIRDDDGGLHTVDFKIEKGYIVFTF